MNVYFALMIYSSKIMNFYFCFHRQNQCLLVFPKYNRNFAANWLLVIFAVSLPFLRFLSISFIYAYCSFLLFLVVWMSKTTICRSQKKKQKETTKAKRTRERKKPKRRSLWVLLFCQQVNQKKNRRLTQTTYHIEVRH